MSTRDSRHGGLSGALAGAEGKGGGHQAKARYDHTRLARGSLGLGCIANFSTPKLIAGRRIITPAHRIASPPAFAMALARPLPPLWQTLLPALNGPARPLVTLPLLQRLAQTPFAALTIPLSLPSIPSLSDIWEGVLKAVPKKKTSYMKKRTRFMAGKGLKDLTNLNKCSACGRVKRAHFLCPYCVDGMCCTRHDPP